MADEHTEKLNEALLTRITDLKTSFNNLKSSVEDRKTYLQTKKEQMDAHRDSTFTEIDQYYDLLIRKLNEKREKCKEDYRSIEQKEKRRLGFVSLQLRNTEEQIAETEEEIKIFTDEFDTEMDYQANFAGFERLQERVSEIRQEQDQKAYFLRNAKYVNPSFETVAGDLEDLSDFGRIIDN